MRVGIRTFVKAVARSGGWEVEGFVMLKSWRVRRGEERRGEGRSGVIDFFWLETRGN